MKAVVRISLAVVALSLCLNESTVAGALEDGVAAGLRGDHAMAYRLWLPLANQGNASAQYALGVLSDNGAEGVPQNYAEAVKWFRKAADQGYARAQYALGVMYNNGEGVPQDYVYAHKWFNLAATAFTNKTDREEAVSNRDLVASKMTPAQIAEAHKLARTWKPTSSASGK